jgi:hypothetical protein
MAIGRTGSVRIKAADGGRRVYVRSAPVLFGRHAV